MGERARVAGFALAGAEVVPVEDPRAVVAAWGGLAADVDVVILTPRAAAALGEWLDEPPRPGRPLPVVLPEVTP
jgi:vacuolar-type H+-ATPase subunit F/Vma7